MPQIVRSLRDQTAAPKEIWLINNDGFGAFGADKVIAIPWNLGECARYMVMRMVPTTFVAFQDDDLIMGDNEFLADALTILQDRAPLAAVGTSGMELAPISPHYSRGAGRDSYCNFLKGHFQIMNKAVLGDVRIPCHPNRGDIQFGLDITGGEPVSWVSRTLAERLEKMNQWGEGLEYRPEHWDEAEAVVAEYVKEYGPWT